MKNLESFQKSFDDVYGMQPDQLQLGFLKVLKGSGMKEDADGYEIRYHEHAPYEVLTTRWLNYGEVLTLKGVEEMVEVYYNSRQFDRTIAHIMEQYDSPYRFFWSWQNIMTERDYPESAIPELPDMRS